MDQTTSTRDRLQQRIHQKKLQIDSFLARIEPRSNRLTLASIVATGLAGLLTIGPAAGGPSFTQAITQALGTTSPSWRLLCAGASILSFFATTALAIYKGQDLSNRVAKAQAAHARLESLETFLDTTDISLPSAAEQYTQVLTDVSFVPAAAN